MADPLRLFVLAGEPSGDRIGAELVRRLRAHRPVAPSGVGGTELEAEGLRSLYPMQDLSVMGLSDVLKRLPLLLWRLRQTVSAIRRQKPDIVVLIDSQVFSQTIAQRLRRAGYTGKIVLYVAPSVWAWKPERAVALRPLFDEILCVLPFEPSVMQQLEGPPASYVGHPALEHTAMRPVQPEQGPLLLLPGSRMGELNRHLGVMREVTRAFGNHPRVTGLVLPTPQHLEAHVRGIVGEWGVPVAVAASASAKQAAFRDALAAVAVSGTVTLELALAGVPLAATYVGDNGQKRHFEKYKGKFVTLPNILSGSALVSETLGTSPQPALVIEELGRLLDEPGAMARQVEGFRGIRAAMETGTADFPRVDAAERVLAHLG